MARVRMEDKEKIQNWEEADLVMKELTELELQQEIYENEMNQKISDIKLEYADKAEPDQKRMKELAKDLKKFVEFHRGDIKGKSRQLNFGKVGYRKSTRITIPKKVMKTIVKLLERRGMDDCVNITKTVNRDMLKKYPDNAIQSLGCVKKEVDVFFYETDREKIKKYWKEQ